MASCITTFRHPGGVYTTNFEDVRGHPGRVLEKAVKGMPPKGRSAMRCCDEGMPAKLIRYRATTQTTAVLIVIS
jgi:hypothetical protein